MLNYWSFIKEPNTDKIRKDILENPQHFITQTLQNRFAFGATDITRTGIYKEMGYAYDFRDFLKIYVYKQYGSWHEIYALNKTNVRKLVGGKIDKIVNVMDRL